MFCPSCGQQNRSDARFCEKCGARLSQGGQAAHMPPPTSQFGTQNTGPGGLGYQSSTTVSRPIPNSPPQKSAASILRSAPVNPSVQPRGQGGIVGVARNIQQRQGTSTSTGYQETILTFRLEQYDSSGNRIRVVPVEMHGLSVTGFISDGDQIEVSGKSKDGLVRAKQARNLTTGSIVEAKAFFTVKAFWPLFVLLGLAALVGIGFLVYWGFFLH